MKSSCPRKVTLANSPIALVHLQRDKGEAKYNLGQSLSRGKSSKVQSQVVDVAVGNHMVPWFTELVAILRKDAATIWTCLYGTIYDIAKALKGHLSPEHVEKKIRFVHLLVGDGIATNNAAAKRLLRHMESAADGTRDS